MIRVLAETGSSRNQGSPAEGAQYSQGLPQVKPAIRGMPWGEHAGHGARQGSGDFLAIPPKTDPLETQSGHGDDQPCNRDDAMHGKSPKLMPIREEG